jgi:hypothetical protein
VRSKYSIFFSCSFAKSVIAPKNLDAKGMSWQATRVICTKWEVKKLGDFSASCVG